MSKMQAFLLGIMVCLTPSMLLLAYWLLPLPNGKQTAGGPSQERHPGGHRG